MNNETNESAGAPDIRTMAKDAPDKLVERLVASDMDYWEAVKAQVLRPFFSNSVVYQQRMADANVELDDIYREVYLRMVTRGKLSALHNRQFVCSFILEYAKAYVRGFFDDPGAPEPVTCKGRPRKPRIEYWDPNPADRGAWMESVPQEPTTDPDNDDLPDETLSTYEALRAGFDNLWAKNPRRAVAVLLRYVKGLSACEVQRFMNLASENYVNQVVSVAKGDLRQSVLSVEEALGRDFGKGTTPKQACGSASSAGYRGTPFMLAFEACLPKGHRDWWCASVQIDDSNGEGEVELADDCEVPILVGDNEGNPLEGELIFAGLSLPVTGGKSSCSLKRLRLALANKSATFRSEASGKVEGKLSLR